MHGLETGWQSLQPDLEGVRQANISSSPAGDFLENGREVGRDDEMANDATLPMTYASGSAPNLSSFSYGHFKIWSRDTPDRDFPQSTKHDGTLHPPIHLHSSYTCWNRSWPSKLSCKFHPSLPTTQENRIPLLPDGLPLLTV